MPDKPRTWCPQCGPGVDTSQGYRSMGKIFRCCRVCGLTATGPGADAACEALERARELEAAQDAIRVEVVKFGDGEGETFIDAVCGRVAICSLLDIEAEAQMEETIDADGVYKCTATHDRATGEWDLDVLSYEPLTDADPTQEEPTDG